MYVTQYVSAANRRPLHGGTKQCVGNSTRVCVMQYKSLNTNILFVRHGAHHRAKDHGGAKPCDKQLPNGATVKAIMSVQRIDVWTLQPVTSCGVGGGVRRGVHRGHNRARDQERLGDARLADRHPVLHSKQAHIGYVPIIKLYTMR